MHTLPAVVNKHTFSVNLQQDLDSFHQAVKYASLPPPFAMMALQSSLVGYLLYHTLEAY